MGDDKREALADLEHQQWAHWTRYMLKTLEPLLSPNLRWNPDVRGNAEAALERWLRQINTPYADLTESEKNSDRWWADKVLEIMGQECALLDSIVTKMEVVHTPSDASRLDGAWTCEIETSSEVVGLPDSLAQHEITQFLRYLQTCGGHDAPFDLKAHLPRLQRLLDAHDKSGAT